MRCVGVSLTHTALSFATAMLLPLLPSTRRRIPSRPHSRAVVMRSPAATLLCLANSVADSRLCVLQVSLVCSALREPVNRASVASDTLSQHDTPDTRILYPHLVPASCTRIFYPHLVPSSFTLIFYPPMNPLVTRMKYPRLPRGYPEDTPTTYPHDLAAVTLIYPVFREY